MIATTNHIGQARALLRALVQRIPVTLHDVDKQLFLTKKVLKALNPEHELLLRQTLERILSNAQDFGASDVEIGGRGTLDRVWLRIQGDKKPLAEMGEFSPDEFNLLILSALTESQRLFLCENRSFDFSYEVAHPGKNPVRYRACAYFELGELAMNMRIINCEIRPYQGYGFHPAVTRVLSLNHTKEGLILVTGITGSGKSTTLDSVIDLNNRTAPGHVVVIARPIEFIHQSKKCLIRHREVGLDTRSFKYGTIEALRQDPDIIVIGEMRDPETILTALEAADSGHKVFSTLHTSSAIESIDRIIGEVSPAEQDRVRNRLADILRCVISQRLIPSVSGKLILAKEIMIMTPSIRAAIKNRNIAEIYQMIAEGANYGMMTFEQDLRRLVAENKISTETAMNYANNKRRMKQLLQMN